MAYNPVNHFENIVNNAPEARDEKYIHHRSSSSCVMKYIELPGDKKLSVQASEHTYCRPCDNEGPYTHVEVGYPKGVHLPDSWEEYADGCCDSDDWRDSNIFGHVPVELVRQLIEENS